MALGKLVFMGATLVLITLAAVYVKFEPIVNNHSIAILQQLRSSNTIRIRFNTKSDPNIEYTAFIETSQSDTLQITGQLTYEEEGNLHNYTISGNKGYYSVESASTGSILTSDCLSSSQIPPLHLLEQSLYDGTVVDVVNNGKNRNNCPKKHKLIQIALADEHFIICINPELSEITSIHTDEIDATLEFLPTHPGTFPLPKAIEACDAKQPDDDVRMMSTSRRVLQSMQSRATQWSDAIFSRERRGLFFNEQCTCQMEPKHCLFIHGAGQETAGPVQSTFPEYWGKIQERAPCCKTSSFIRMDTISENWFDGTLSQQVCDTAIDITNDTTTIIENTIFITHSMGNLIVANAIASGLCTIGESSKWVASQGPLEGSQSANRLEEFCQAPSTDTPWFQLAGNKVLNGLGLCPVPQAFQGLIFEGTNHTEVATMNVTGLDDYYAKAQEAYRANVDAAICGTDPFGITSLRSVVYGLAGKLSHHGSESDGVVEVDSCARPLDQEFGSDYRNSPFMKGRINHSDGTFSNRDGWYGKDRKPIKWFECLF